MKEIADLVLGAFELGSAEQDRGRTAGNNFYISDAQELLAGHFGIGVTAKEENTGTKCETY